MPSVIFCFRDLGFGAFDGTSHFPMLKVKIIQVMKICVRIISFNIMNIMLGLSNCVWCYNSSFGSGSGADFQLFGASGSGI